MSEVVTWVVGSGGLLGRNVALQARSRGRLFSPSSPIRWGSPDAELDLRTNLTRFASSAEDAPWQILWCAGAGVTGTTSDQLGVEVKQFEGFLDGLRTSGLAQGGTMFLASSAGAIYAGANRPPFDETTPTASISPYGNAKLAMESALRHHARATGHDAVIGRIANLYGPGQNLAKPQGLLSQIIKSHLLRRPIQLFVSLDTLRDYLFAPDCARLVLDLAAAPRRTGLEEGGAVIKILASQRALTIAAILAELRRLLRRPPELVFCDSPSARFQVHDLRLRSVVMPELDARPLTTLPAGLRSTMDDIGLQLRRGALT